MNGVKAKWDRKKYFGCNREKYIPDIATIVFKRAVPRACSLINALYKQLIYILHEHFFCPSTQYEKYSAGLSHKHAFP